MNPFLIPLLVLIAVCCPAGVRAERQDPRTRALPATVVVVVRDSEGAAPRIGAGVVVSPEGLVVTSGQLIGKQEGARVWVHLYGPEARGLQAPEAYVTARWRFGLEAKVERKDEDLTLLRLPSRPSGYPVIDMADSDDLRPGQVLVGLGRARELVWSGSGRLVAQGNPPVMKEQEGWPCLAGAPVLNEYGHMVSMSYGERSDKGKKVCVYYTSNRLRSIVLGKDSGTLGAAGLEDPLPQARDMLAAVAGQMIEKLGRAQVARVLGELWVANARSGRYAAQVPVPAAGELLNETLKAVALGGKFPPAELAKFVDQRMPRVVTGSDHKSYRLARMKYGPLASSSTMESALALAVDDADGVVYAVDGQGQVLYYDDKTAQWRLFGVSEKALEIAASGGRVFVLLQDGRLVASGKGGGTRGLSEQPLSGALQASGGVLYALTSKGELLRAQQGGLEKALASGVKQVGASGATWFALSTEGKVLAGDKAAYHDLGQGVVGLWMAGPRLVVQTRHNYLFEYDTVKGRWTSIPF